MSSPASTDLRARLAAALPGALAPPRPLAATDGAQPRSHPKRGEAPPADPLATNDIVVLPERIVDVALHLRDAHGYQLLSNITAVDYLTEGVFEIVYHFCRLEGGPPLPIKARVPRDAPELPSLTPAWPGADFQEREAFDLFGVVFRGHPNLRRIYLWDEFEGFPMRKDFPKQGDKYLEEA
jgi:NADH-quinone oxidoreductase subunit C